MGINWEDVGLKDREACLGAEKLEKDGGTSACCTKACQGSCWLVKGLR